MPVDPSLRRTILVVEDEWLLAEEMQAMLEAMDFDVVGPFPSVEKAMRLIEREPPDAAVLDVSVNGVKSFPIAQAMRDRGRPFMFITGYVSADLPKTFGDCLLLSKPVSERTLRKAIATLLP